MSGYTDDRRLADAAIKNSQAIQRIVEVLDEFIPSLIIPEDHPDNLREAYRLAEEAEATALGVDNRKRGDKP